MFKHLFSLKITPFMRHVEKYGAAGQATDDIIRRERITCWIPQATNTHTQCAVRTAFLLEQWLH
jgi:hypothetical protein